MAGGFSRSARFGQVAGGDPRVTIRFDTRDMVRLVDQLSNRFLGGAFQDALAGVNIRAAIVIQHGIANALDDRIKEQRNLTGRDRLRRPGERLRHAIMDENNIEVTASSFRVGIPSWYDRSPAALYWRAVEHGRGPHEVKALFTNALEGNMTPQGGFIRPSPAPIANYRMLIMHNARRAPTFIVENPAYEFHEAGVRRAADRLNIAENYRRALSQIGLEMQMRA